MICNEVDSTNICLEKRIHVQNTQLMKARIYICNDLFFMCQKC